MISSLLWDIMQSILGVRDVSGRNYPFSRVKEPMSLECVTLEDRTGRLSQNVGN